MQKVLHIIPRLGNGGAEKLLLSTAPHYLKHNLKIKIICLTSESQICDELRSRSIDVLCMHGNGRMYDLLIVKNLLKTIINEKPDIVISHLLMANFFAFISCFLTFKKHIPVIHNLNTEYSIKDKFLNFLIKIFSYRIICVSNTVKTFEDINQPAFVKSKTRVLYNAIDISFFEKNTGHWSWWDYRNNAYQLNKGWRIDHIYISKELSSKLKSCVIDSSPRTNLRPSDHVPVMIDLNLNEINEDFFEDEDDFFEI